jgi:PDZ domain-containing protein
VSYKLLRLLLGLIGVASLGGFGWTFYDFIVHKAEYNQPFTATEAKKLSLKPKMPPKSDVRGHLQEWKGNFDNIHKLNVTGYVAPVVANGPDVEAEKPKPRFGPDDVTLASIMFSSTRPAAFLIPAGAEAVGGLPPGELFIVGDQFEVPAKPGLSLEVRAIRGNEVDLSTIEGTDPFTLVIPLLEVDEGSLLVGKVGGSETARVYEAPRLTEKIDSDTYAIGSADLEKLAQMPDDQIYAAVRVQPARNALQKVRGLRITSIQSGSLFEKIGLKVDDVVLSVNGLPAKDRGQLLSELRKAASTDTVRVVIERRGGQRTLTYRVPI